MNTNVVSLVSCVVVSCLACVVGGLDILAATPVAKPHDKTKPPTEFLRPQYAQTLYKNTEAEVVRNTLVPLWPSSDVSYAATQTTTLQNQTIATTTAEFQTVLNSTVLYEDLEAAQTWDVAATTYQTMDFQYQKVLMTESVNSTYTSTMTQLDHNMLPFV